MLALVSTPEIHQANIHRAAKTGHVLLTELLIAKGADVNARDEGGWTPLIHASENGHFQVVDLLIQAGGEVDSQDEEGRTPLLRASYYGHVEVITALLAAGADKTIKAGYTGRTAHSKAKNQDCKNALE